MKPKFFLLLVSFVLFIGLTSAPLTAQEEGFVLAANDQLVYVWAETSDSAIPFVPPPVAPDQLAPMANIQVNYIGSWPAAAQSAFEYAASIWEAVLVAGVTIEVDAEWRSDLPPGALGGAGPYASYRDFPNAPQGSTWYPVALANTLAGTDLNGGNPEIDAVFSSTFSWYFGTNGAPPSSTYDFVSVVLHELGHGLGFVGSMRVQAGLGSWGSGSGYPFIYDRYTENNGGQPLLSFPNNSAVLAGELMSNNVYFDGPNANTGNGGGRSRLYAPGSWQQGSSYSHLNESTFPAGNPNALMTPQISNGEANHSPGPITLGIFKDSGWVLANQNTAPVIVYLPDQLLLQGTTRNNAIDLWAYTSDAQTGDSGLSFTLTSNSNASAGVSLDSNRYIDIFPNANWTGQADVTVRVTDPSGLTDSETFTVVVMNEIFNTYLPLALR